MTFEADTLVQLAAKLKKQGLKRIADIIFLRAPCRVDHKWVCTVLRRKP
ncbi:hypothetical protein [Pseudomonas cremoricolorata]|nr:hypothetical protein [Pseudomonas cremoricolorata]